MTTTKVRSEEKTTPKTKNTRVSVADLRKLALPLLKIAPQDDADTKVDKRESVRDLVRALTEAVYGELVPVVAFYYDKDPTKGEGRVSNVDYLPLPGLDDDFHFGQLMTVARSNKGNIYFKMRDLSRANGTDSWAWTCVRPDRIRSFQYRGAFPNPDHGKARAGEWTGKRP